MNKWLLYPVFYLVTVWHSVPLVSLSHMLAIVMCDSWFHSISLLATEVSTSWWIVHICQYMCTAFILPDHCNRAISYPRINIILFRLFGGNKLCGIPFLLCPFVPQLIFLHVGSLNKSGDGKKLSMYFHLFCQSFYSSMCCCLICGYSKTFLFLGYLFENYPSLEKYCNFVQDQMFRRGVIFWVCYWTSRKYVLVFIAS
jgi:hypothetical protein